MQLMRMNVSKHSRDHADSDYVSYVGVDRKGAHCIGNKQTDEQTFKHWTLYMSTNLLALGPLDWLLPIGPCA